MRGPEESTMAGSEHKAPARALVSQDGMRAELVLAAHADTNELTTEFCLAALRNAEVEISAEVKARVAKGLEAYTTGEESRVLVARGTPPEHGADGYVEWSVAPGAEPPPLDDTDPIEGTGVYGPAIDYYEQRAFVMVQTEQELGTLHQETAGVDGRDVRGKSLAAKSGKPARISFDESILVRGDGVLVAQQQGVLSRSADKAAIREHLEIPGYVDFSTGNIDFTGDVAVAKGVRDLFKVEARGNVEVRGLIEAAEISCEGDLLARGGMAGRERGAARVRGDLIGKYLDAARVDVSGALRVDREIINCHVIVHGTVESPHGSLIGGELIATGKVEIGTLGSSSCVETAVVLDRVPLLEDRLVQFERLFAEVEERRDRFEEESEKLSDPGRRLSASEVERQTELSFELHMLREKHAKLADARRTLHDRIDALRTVDLSVGRMLHTGVRIVVGHQCFRVEKDIKGPLRVLKDRTGMVVYRVGESGAPVPLSTVSELLAAA